MAWRYLKRSREPVLNRAVVEFPAVALTGPRQSGKTTLLKHLFGETHSYVSLEPPDIRASHSKLEAYFPYVQKSRTRDNMIIGIPSQSAV